MARRFGRAVTREHTAILQRRHVASVRMLISDPQKLAAFDLAHPESGLTPLPKKRAPRTVASGPSEHQLQAAVIKWWALACSFYGLPYFALFAIPNGGARDPITGARLKAEGVRPGVYDLMLAVSRGEHCGLFLEMKTSNNKPTEAQLTFMYFIRSQRYQESEHWSSESAIDAIKAYLAP